MIDLLLKYLKTTEGKKGQLGISGLAIVCALLMWNLTEKVSDIRERIVRIETKLGIEAKRTERRESAVLQVLPVQARTNRATLP